VRDLFEFKERILSV